MGALDWCAMFSSLLLEGRRAKHVGRGVLDLGSQVVQPLHVSSAVGSQQDSCGPSVREGRLAPDLLVRRTPRSAHPVRSWPTFVRVSRGTIDLSGSWAGLGCRRRGRGRRSGGRFVAGVVLHETEFVVLGVGHDNDDAFGGVVVALVE